MSNSIYLVWAISLIIMSLIVLVIVSLSRVQLIFQRAYVEVEGNHINKLLDIFKIDKLMGDKTKIEIELIDPIHYEIKGEAKTVGPFTRISRLCFKWFTYDRTGPNETVKYLKEKIEKHNLKVTDWGYY